MADDVNMDPDMTPEEQDEAIDSHRERLRRLRELAPPTDPGEIRAREREIDETKRRLRELGADPDQPDDGSDPFGGTPTT
jgi:hypothetical protein